MRRLCGFVAVMAVWLLLGTIGLHQAAAEEVYAPRSLRIVDANGQPVQGVVRLLCYDQPNPTGAGRYLEGVTDEAGRLTGVLPADCTWLAVLHQLSVQASGKPGRTAAYRVFRTSWQPGSRTLFPAGGEIVVRDAWRLVLFEVAVSLEWEPEPSSPYVARFQEGLLAASRYLYDLTDGQAAFGAVGIETGGVGWDGADFRVRAANDYRPTALVGGMVAAARPYTTPAGAETVYVPGGIYLGRYWDGSDAFDPAGGDWPTPAASRTLVHEWLHYAFFLYDEYQEAQDTGPQETYCTCRDLPLVGPVSVPEICSGAVITQAASAMAYHYTATELWKTGLPPACASTDQQRVHGEPDWPTLARWSAVQGNTEEWLTLPSDLLDGPDLGRAADLFGRIPQPLAGVEIYLPVLQKGQASRAYGRAGAELGIRVAISTTSSVTELAGLAPQVHLFQPGDGPEGRVLVQGTTHGPPAGSALGGLTLFGDTKDGTLDMSLDRYAPEEGESGRYRVVTDSLRAGAVYTLTRDGWTGSLDLVPFVEDYRLAALTVTLTTSDALSAAPAARLCAPDGQVGCRVTRTLQPVGEPPDGRVWTTVFTATGTGDLPHLAVIDVTAQGSRITRWYQAAGGVGPAHMWEEAPLRDGPVLVDAVKPGDAAGFGGQVLILPAADRGAVDAPLPPGVSTLLGHPWDVDVVLPPSMVRGARMASQGPDRFLAKPVVLTLFYSQQRVNSLGVGENHLRLLRYDRAGHRWTFVPGAGQSTRLNWLASQPVWWDGIYGVGVLASLQTGKYAPQGPVAPGDPIPYTVVIAPGLPITTPVQMALVDPLPQGVEMGDLLVCTPGACQYREDIRTVIWQGVVQPGEAATVFFNVFVAPAEPTACPEEIVNRAQIFEGDRGRSVEARTQVACP